MSARYFAGMGCRRGVTAAVLRDLLMNTLRAHAIPSEQLTAIASIDSKRDEPALRELAELLDVSLLFFSSGQLQAYADRVSAPSASVLNAVGVNVAEAAALASAEMFGGARAALATQKHKNDEATCAVAFIMDTEQ